MLKNCFGIISSRNVAEDFGALTKPRESYMLPFGGRYRLVDFMLSNMVNHGIDTIAVYTGNKVRSTMDHIGDGQPWELNRRISGLHIFPPQHIEGVTRAGDIDQYYLTEDFLKGVKEENIYVVASNVLAKINLSQAYKEFLESDADVSLIFAKVKNEEIYHDSESLVFDEAVNFVNIGVNLGSQEQVNLYLGSAFIKKETFRQLVREAKEVGEERYLRGAFLNAKKELKVVTYEHKGSVDEINSIAKYYRASMNLLDKKNSNDIFFEGGLVYTRSKDEPPTLYTDDSLVENSIVANGCVIEGTVTNSIIFRGVKIKKGAVIKDSIVMQKSIIEEDAYIVKSILDKNVTIDEKVTIVGTISNPYIVEKGTRIRKAE